MKQFAWLPRDFSTYFGHNWGLILGNYLIIGSFTLLDVQSFSGADCDTDHYLVVTEIGERLALN